MRRHKICFSKNVDHLSLLFLCVIVVEKEKEKKSRISFENRIIFMLKMLNIIYNIN